MEVTSSGIFGRSQKNDSEVPFRRPGVRACHGPRHGLWGRRMVNRTSSGRYLLGIDKARPSHPGMKKTPHARATVPSQARSFDMLKSMRTCARGTLDALFIHARDAVMTTAAM